MQWGPNSMHGSFQSLVSPKRETHDLNGFTSFALFRPILLFVCNFSRAWLLGGWWSRAKRSKFEMKRSSCRWQHPMKMDWSEMKAEVCPWLCLVSHDFSLCNLPVGFAKTNSILWRLNFKSLKRLKLGEDWFELWSGVKFGSGIPPRF